MDKPATYAQLLKDERWLEKRKEIIERDKGICQDCGKKGINSIDEKWVKFSFEKDSVKKLKKHRKSVDRKHRKGNILNVHHKVYYYDPILRSKFLPWDYDNSDLVTLCSECHTNLHKKQTIDVINMETGTRIPLIPCFRCSGVGYLYHYNHVENGICFRCGGMRFEANQKFLKYDNLDEDSVESSRLPANSVHSIRPLNEFINASNLPFIKSKEYEAPIKKSRGDERISISQILGVLFLIYVIFGIGWGLIFHFKNTIEQLSLFIIPMVILLPVAYFLDGGRISRNDSNLSDGEDDLEDDLPF